MSQKAKFGCSIFQLKIKRKQIFQVQRQFQNFKYDMNWKIVTSISILSIDWILKRLVILGLYPKNFKRVFTSLLDSSRSVSPTFDNALFFVKEWEHSSLKNRQLFVGNYAIFSHYLQQIHRGNMSWKGNKDLFHLWYPLASFLLEIDANFIWYNN